MYIYDLHIFVERNENHMYTHKQFHSTKLSKNSHSNTKFKSKMIAFQRPQELEEKHFRWEDPQPPPKAPLQTPPNRRNSKEIQRV